MNDDEDIKITKKFIIWLVIGLFIISGIGWFATRTVSVIDSGIIHYEEFQEIYNTCQKLNLDLCNMKDLPETDMMFEQFSKAQRINTLRNQMNRWTEEYNAKSKMFNRSIWKSSALPYELHSNTFNCY